MTVISAVTKLLKMMSLGKQDHVSEILLVRSDWDFSGTSRLVTRLPAVDGSMEGAILLGMADFLQKRIDVESEAEKVSQLHSGKTQSSKQSVGGKSVQFSPRTESAMSVGETSILRGSPRSRRLSNQEIMGRTSVVEGLHVQVLECVWDCCVSAARQAEILKMQSLAYHPVVGRAHIQSRSRYGNQAYRG